MFRNLFTRTLLLQILKELHNMSTQLDTLTSDVSALQVAVAALIAKPPVTVPEDLSAVIASVEALTVQINAVLSPPAA